MTLRRAWLCSPHPCAASPETPASCPPPVSEETTGPRQAGGTLATVQGIVWAGGDAGPSWDHPGQRETAGAPHPWAGVPASLPAAQALRVDLDAWVPSHGPADLVSLPIWRAGEAQRLRGGLGTCPYTLGPRGVTEGLAGQGVRLSAAPTIVGGQQHPGPAARPLEGQVVVAPEKAPCLLLCAPPQRVGVIS